MPSIPPKDIELRHRDEESADGHPETVGERCDRECGDENGKGGGYEDDEGFGSEQVQEEVEDVVEEF
jgi:hypothetical protein